MYISSFPTLGFFRRKSTFDEFTRVFNEQKTFFFYRGAFAIWHAIKLLKLSSAEATILVPAYHCGVEIEAILQAGAKVRFYNIKEDLQADIQDIQRKIDNTTKALFIIHYFGFPQPLEALKDICSRNGIFLIEDCAHALFSRAENCPLGTFGDIGIFSFIKSLPVPDGGAMVVNNKLCSEFHLKQKRTLISGLRRRTLLLSEYLHMVRPSIYYPFELILFGPIKFMLRYIKKLLPIKPTVAVPDSMNFDISLVTLGMSIVSRNILKESDFKTIIEERRENYLFLQEQLSGEEGFCIVFKELPHDVCPLFFPILIEKRDEMQKRLKESGINAFVFGKSLHSSMAGNDFSNAQYFAAHNLCLPIHQDLEQKHLAYMAEKLTHLLQNRDEKVAHVISSNGLFGAEKVMISIASQINYNGMQSSIVAIQNAHNPHTEVVEVSRVLGIPAVNIESRGRIDLRVISRLTGYIKANSITLLHTHNYKANLIGLLAAKRAGIPIVATLHGYIGNGKKLKCYEALDRLILRYFDRVILVGDSLKKWFRNGAVKYEVICNGVNTNGMPSDSVTQLQVKSELGIRDGDLMIGTVGRLSKEKGHKYLIEAFIKLSQEYPNICLLIVGDGELRKELERLSETLGIKEKVTFTGYQEDVAKYYSSMDIYVSPSLVEHFPMSILEAMSFSRAVVATDVGGISKMILNENTGLIVKPQSAEEIYQALLRLIGDSALRKKLAGNAGEFVKRNYSLEKMLAGYKKVYNEV